MGPFASKNVIMILIMRKMNLKGPLSLKPTTVDWYGQVTLRACLYNAPGDFFVLFF